MNRYEALQQIKKLSQDRGSILIIHYSCESFYNMPEGFSPRISSIGVKNFSSGQTYSFSIAQAQDQLKINNSELDSRYEEAEKWLLNLFFDFLDTHQSNYFVHWNMRNSMYSFQAIYHRYRILGGSPLMLSESRLFDLADILKSIYGKRYADDPRLDKLADLNDINKRDFLTGAEDAEAFTKREFSRIMRSSIRKVEVISQILDLQLQHKLKKKVSGIKSFTSYQFTLLPPY